MPHWREGWRELTDDIERVRIWLAVGAALMGAVATGLWLWWAYFWKVPPPIQAVSAGAVFVLSWVVLYFVALVGHKYFRFPTRNPRRFLSVNKDEPASRDAGPKHEQNPAASTPPPTPHTVVTTNTAPKSGQRELIPADEFKVQGYTNAGALYLKVENPYKNESKTGFSIRLINMYWYSATLDGKGGFVEWPWFKELKGPKVLAGESVKQLHHGDSTYFVLLRAPGGGSWQFVMAGSATVLNKSDRWRFVLELRWNDKIWPLLADVVLGVKGGEKVADLTLVQGNDIPPYLASLSGSDNEAKS